MRSGPGCWQVDERVKDMNAGGILGSICFPSFPGLRGPVVRDGGSRVLLALLQAYNDWHVEEWCAAYPARFIPMSSAGDLGRRGLRAKRCAATPSAEYTH